MVSVSVYMEKRQNTISLFFSFFTFFEADLRGNFHCLNPFWSQQEAGRKPISKQENAIAKSAIGVVRGAEAVGLGANSK